MVVLRNNCYIMDSYSAASWCLFSLRELGPCLLHEKSLPVSDSTKKAKLPQRRLKRAS